MSTTSKLFVGYVESKLLTLCGKGGANMCEPNDTTVHAQHQNHSFVGLIFHCIIYHSTYLFIIYHALLSSSKISGV